MTNDTLFGIEAPPLESVLNPYSPNRLLAAAEEIHKSHLLWQEVRLEILIAGLMYHEGLSTVELGFLFNCSHDSARHWVLHFQELPEAFMLDWIVTVRRRCMDAEFRRQRDKHDYELFRNFMETLPTRREAHERKLGVRVPEK